VPNGITAGPDGNLWFTETVGNKIGRINEPLEAALAQFMAVDAHTVIGGTSDANGVLEPGETVQVDPSWTNMLATPTTFTGIASDLAGPAGLTYTIDDSTAEYDLNFGETRDCHSTTGDCYLMTVSGTRPAAHWDATFTEDLNYGASTKVWTLHVGESFPDVPTSNQFYASTKVWTLHVGESFPDVPTWNQFYGFIENIFHNGVTGGCAGGNYCPDNSVTRAQMAVFLLKGKLGASHVPPHATGTVFNDVHVGDFAADWIEELAGFQITGGCGGGNYCPNDPVTRAQMAVFLLKTNHGSAYAPPDCTGVFADVECSPMPAFAVNWIEQLAAEGITEGCGGGNYCPANSNTRGQMAVFLVKTFGLQLYGP
jgi:S-layer family protein